MSLKKLITKYLTGSQAFEEKNAIDIWKQEAEENLAGLKELMSIELNSSVLLDYKDVNKDLAWNKIQERTGQVKPKSKIIQYSKIAAIFVCIIGAVAIFKLNTPDLSNSIVYAGDKIQNVSLKDGSKITLESKSVITETSFRNIKLEGKAYFDIYRNPAVPFVIALNHGQVTVVGTEFNINTTPEKTIVVVTEGKVKINYKGKLYLLSAGEGITLRTNENVQQTNHVISPDDWKNKVLKFDNQSLYNVLVSVAFYYNLELDWTPPTLDDQCKINTSFKDETIEQVLKEIQLLAGIQYELTPSKIILKSFKC